MKLQRFSLPAAARLVGALGLIPELQANTIRIEILTHLVVTCCRGSAMPKFKDLSEWVRLMASSTAAHLEDPVEDQFIGCANSRYGSFRIFQGNFSDGAFLVERLLDFYGKKPDAPTFQETIDRVIAILKIADALAEKAGLQRYDEGSGNHAQRLIIPSRKVLESRIKSIIFTHQDLKELGAPEALLDDFILSKPLLTNINLETLWASTLERHPLLRVEKGILVIEPSTLSRTVVRYMVERLKFIAGFADIFYRAESADVFVNDVASRLGINPIEFTPPEAEEGTPHLMPCFGLFDVGMPVVMLTYTPSIQGAINNFSGVDTFSKVEQEKFQNYIQSCANKLEKLPHFNGGMVLICIAGYGRSCELKWNHWSPKWRVYSATLRDWMALTGAGCTAVQLWKLGKHKDHCESLGVELVNPAGLLNLFSFWRNSEFRLVPKQLDIQEIRKIIYIDCAHSQLIRVLEAQKLDEHCIERPGSDSFSRIVRQNSRTFFLEDNHAPIYGAINEAQERLVGCTKRGCAVWWVVAEYRPDRPELRDLLYQLWDCVLQWTDHLVAVVEREWPEIRRRDIEVHLVLPNFEQWSYGDANTLPSEPEEISIKTDQQKSRITLTIPEGFLLQFNAPKNIAEQKIVASIFRGAAHLSGRRDSEEAISCMTHEVVRNDDTRYFHVVEMHEIEHFYKAEHKPHPLFVADEDTNLATLGLADLVGRPAEGNQIIGQESCRTFLQKIVEKVWERLEKRLERFDRTYLVQACFRAIDEISRDQTVWHMTTRSVFALHNDHDNTREVLRNRRSQQSIAHLANRILIETAQYACLDDAKEAFFRADHALLLSEVKLLIELAHHRDAIAFGVMKPEITIYPNGEIDVDNSFYNETFFKYLSHRSDNDSNKAAKAYEQYFEAPEVFSDDQSKAIDCRISKLNAAFEPEFGVSIEKILKIMDVFRDFAIKSGVPCRLVKEREMLKILQEGCEFSTSEAEAFLVRLTLPIRPAWDENLPPNCKKEDVYPWRFRRHLSLLARPLVQVAISPRTWVISAPFIEKSLSYLLGNIESANFPERFFSSANMRSYLGHEVNRRGHDFAERIRNIFNDHGLESRFEIEMTEIGASKSLGLGDIDVLAWNPSTGRVFAAECKRLLPALTIREVLQRLEDFRGNKKVKDSLGRHLRRVDWIRQHLNSLSRITDIPTESIQLTPLLVTSEIVPMQFFKEMEFPTEQVIPADDLSQYINQR
ncbi:hypothetical protein [Ruficoccus sp. ZRK36]|uniref:hypothetical protein n=1 Tax=Ruficoccus sp. ZRK36 TaxID=2866311 RepID=UPI001C73D09A|nr:hypothetical protein [Ruficoccus sp. ZRK36]QYY34649.1 hypothetical protein K0V07_10070 [Ruficoccus sp. ZRK36]